MAIDVVRELVGYSHATQQLHTVHHPSVNAKHRAISTYTSSDVKTSNLEKALQTLAVLYHVLTIYPLVPGAIIALYALYYPARVLVPILISLLLPRSYSRRSDLLRSLPVWRLVASYFPIKLYRTTPLPPTQRYIFGYHPHGILSHGAFTAFATESLGFSHLFPGLENSLLTLDSNFRIPIYRDYLTLLGMNSVSRSSCEEILTPSNTNSPGRSITIVIGGARESLEAKPGSMRLVLRDRKGFAKLAIRTGATLVPVLGFGENELYTMTADLDPETKTWSGRVQRTFKRVFGLTVPFLYSRGPYKWGFGAIPHRRPVNIVVGRPIPVARMEGEVDGGYLDEVHGRYIEELERIWEEWRGVFAAGAGDIQII